MAACSHVDSSTGPRIVGKISSPDPPILMRWLAGGKRNRTRIDMTAGCVNQLGEARATLTFTPNGGRSLIVASAKKFGMAEVTVFRPFDKTYLDDEPWFDPHAFLHVFKCEAFAPPATFLLRQVCERTTGNF